MQLAIIYIRIFKDQRDQISFHGEFVEKWKLIWFCMFCTGVSIWLLIDIIYLKRHIKFYFIFDKDNIITSHLPNEVRDFIFNPNIENLIVKVDYERPKKPLDLDQLLDKIKETGIESLTPEEKNFLDNFENWRKLLNLVLT